MLLVLSDAYKSLWYLIGPAIAFGTGNNGKSNFLTTNKTFCNIDGFMLSMGIEFSGEWTRINSHSLLH
jgi:G protein-coupled glucose receptor regulating Gpa2